MPALLRRGGAAVEGPAREALLRVLASPTFEILPLKRAREEIGALPAGSRVSVTASLGRGLEATVDLAAELQAQGFDAVPHLSARTVRDRAHLADLLARLAAADLGRAFVVGGDGTDHGAYADGLSLLRAIEEVGPRPRSIGVPCYPDGHPVIPEDALLAALRAKLPYADWMTTQLCFDPTRIVAWLRARREEGIATPAVIGIPGVTEPQRLLSVSAKIGVRDTGRFLRKNLGLVRRLVGSGGFYRPDSLLAGLAPSIAEPGLGVSGLHLYTFNAIATTEAWRRAYLERLAADDARP